MKLKKHKLLGFYKYKKMVYFFMIMRHCCPAVKTAKHKCEGKLKV